MSTLKYKPLNKAKTLSSKSAHHWINLRNSMDSDIHFKVVPIVLIPKVKEMIEYIDNSLLNKQLTLDL